MSDWVISDDGDVFRPDDSGSAIAVQVLIGVDASEFTMENSGKMRLDAALFVVDVLNRGSTVDAPSEVAALRSLLAEAADGLRSLQEQQAMPAHWADELIWRCIDASRGECIAPVTVDPP
jgi:hypothetical protein